MDAVKSVKFERSKKSPQGTKRFEKTPHSNKAGRPAQDDENVGARKKRKLNFSSVESDDEDRATNGQIEKKLSAKALARKKMKESWDKTNNTIFIGNLPAVMTRKDIAECFSVFGKVLNARIRGVSLKPGTKSRKGGAILNEIEKDYINAYVRFSTLEACKLAMRANGVIFEGRHFRIDYADTSLRTENPENKAIFLRNISYDVTEDQLWKFFEQCGEIASVKIETDPKKNYQPRGLGFINFTTPEAAQLAVKLGNSGIEMNGRKILVHAYKSRKGQDKIENNGKRKTKRGGVALREKRLKKKKSNMPDFAGKIAEPKKKTKSEKVKKTKPKN